MTPEEKKEELEAYLHDWEQALSSAENRMSMAKVQIGEAQKYIDYYNTRIDKLNVSEVDNG